VPRVYNEYRVFPGVKVAGAWRWPLTPSSAEIKESVELYLYSIFGPSWPLIRWSLPLPLPTNAHNFIKVTILQHTSS
jgi:hypothetical protein